MYFTGDLLRIESSVQIWMLATVIGYNYVFADNWLVVDNGGKHIANQVLLVIPPWYTCSYPSKLLF